MIDQDAYVDNKFAIATKRLFDIVSPASILFDKDSPNVRTAIRKITMDVVHEIITELRMEAETIDTIAETLVKFTDSFLKYDQSHEVRVVLWNTYLSNTE